MDQGEHLKSFLVNFLPILQHKTHKPLFRMISEGKTQTGFISMWSAKNYNVL